MDKNVTLNVDKTIEYRIDSINIINHSEKHFSGYGLKSSDVKKGDCEIGIDVRIDGEKSCIAVPMKVSMYLKSDGKKYDLFSAEAIYTYRIKKLKSLFEIDEPSKFVIPDEFVRTLIGTALSGMRGIMVALTTVEEYKKIILPLIETTKILENLKKTHSASLPNAKSC